MFNLKERMSEWRQQMMAAGISASALDELESHLREEVQEQIAIGANDRQAFEAAVQRIGPALALKNEFKKIGGTSRTLEMLMIGVCAVFVALIIFLGGATVVLGFSSLSDRIIASVPILSSLVIACHWKYLVRFLPVIADTRKRFAAGVACIACGFGAPSFIGDVLLRGIANRSPAIDRIPEISSVEFWWFLVVTVFVCAGIGLLLNQQKRENLE